MTDNINHTLAERLAAVRARIQSAERRFAREPGSVQLLAVSKRHPADAIRACAAMGQRLFGESYAQEALEKIHDLADLDLEWHFIGPLQSNKTRPIAERFHWVHSVDREKTARRLSEQRPAALPPLNVCLQVNISAEASKSGCTLEELTELAPLVATLPGLRLRGLMGIPAHREGFEAQREPFRCLREALEGLRRTGLELDTLSMGMSDDLEAAVAGGATLVRIGSAIFGPRG